MSLSCTAEELGAALRAERRRKVPVGRLGQLLHEIEPQVAYSPQRRRRLQEVIDELAHAGAVSLPHGKGQYDRLEQPPLPRFVLVEGLAAPISRKATDAETYPWLPELRWAASLKPPLRVDEMETLRKVSAFLSARRGWRLPVVPLQERSLEIFGDEKRIGELARQRLFVRGRLDFTLLACREVHPPFVYTRLSRLPTLLAVENSATYDTMLRVLDAGGPIGVLAYGAGKHFVLSVAAACDLDPVPRRILYFGDVDPDGLFIPHKASATATEYGLPQVEPAEVLYERLFRCTPEPQTGTPDGTGDERVAWLPESLRARAADLLLRSDRLAQEHVGLELLCGDRGWIDGLRCQLERTATSSAPM